MGPVPRIQVHEHRLHSGKGEEVRLNGRRTDSFRPADPGGLTAESSDVTRLIHLLEEDDDAVVDLNEAWGKPEEVETYRSGHPLQGTSSESTRPFP